MKGDVKVTTKQSVEEKEAERQLLDRFEQLDNIATGDHKGERMGQVKSQYLQAPTSQNWYDKNVGVPQRLALFSMFCILLYEVLVFASMGVRRLRWMMVNWLMYVMLALNVSMMICLAAFVWLKKKDVGIGKLTDLATGRGKEKQEFAV